MRHMFKNQMTMIVMSLISSAQGGFLNDRDRSFLAYCDLMNKRVILLEHDQCNVLILPLLVAQ